MYLICGSASYAHARPQEKENIPPESVHTSPLAGRVNGREATRSYPLGKGASSDALEHLKLRMSIVSLILLHLGLDLTCNLFIGSDGKGAAAGGHLELTTEARRRGESVI